MQTINALSFCVTAVLLYIYMHALCIMYSTYYIHTYMYIYSVADCLVGLLWSQWQAKLGGISCTIAIRLWWQTAKPHMVAYNLQEEASGSVYSSLANCCLCSC